MFSSNQTQKIKGAALILLAGVFLVLFGITQIFLNQTRFFQEQSPSEAKQEATKTTSTENTNISSQTKELDYKKLCDESSDCISKTIVVSDKFPDLKNSVKWPDNFTGFAYYVDPSNFPHILDLKVVNSSEKLDFTCIIPISQKITKGCHKNISRFPAFLQYKLKEGKEEITVDIFFVGTSSSFRKKAGI